MARPLSITTNTNTNNTTMELAVVLSANPKVPYTGDPENFVDLDDPEALVAAAREAIFAQGMDETLGIGGCKFVVVTTKGRKLNLKQEELKKVKDVAVVLDDGTLVMMLHVVVEPPVGGAAGGAAAGGGGAEAEGKDQGKDQGNDEEEEMRPRDARCPWLVSVVAADGSVVSDDGLAQCIVDYAKKARRFSAYIGTHGISGTDEEKARKLLQRGRENMNKYYEQLERECSPFLPTEEYRRLRSECIAMMRECGDATAQDIARKCFGQIEDTLMLFATRAGIRGGANGIGGYVKKLEEADRLPPTLATRLHSAAQFRNVNLGHEPLGAGQGVIIPAATTERYLRLYLDLLNESTASPIMGMEEEVKVDEDGDVSLNWQKKFEKKSAWCITKHGFSPLGLDMTAMPFHVALNGLTKKLVEVGSWTDEDLSAVDDNLEGVNVFICTRKEATALTFDFLEALRDRLQAKYEPTYDAVGGLLKDDEYHAKALIVFAEAQRDTEGKGTLCQDRNSLPTLYMAAQKIQSKYDKIVGQIVAGIVAASGSEEMKFMAASLKCLFRAMEKTVLKASADPNLGRADNVRKSVGLVSWRAL